MAKSRISEARSSSYLGLLIVLVICWFMGQQMVDTYLFTETSSVQTTATANQVKKPTLPKPIKNIVRLAGNTPQQLKDAGFQFEIPGEPDWAGGITPQFHTTSWKEAYFSFNGKGILIGVDLHSKSPVSYADAVKIMNEMGIKGSPSTDVPLLWRWDTPGPGLKTAYISKAELNGGRVNRFFISFAIRWDQEKP